MTMTFKQKVGEAMLRYALDCFDFSEEWQGRLERVLGRISEENLAQLKMQRAYCAEIAALRNDLEERAASLYDPATRQPNERFEAATALQKAWFYSHPNDGEVIMDEALLALAMEMSQKDIDVLVSGIQEDWGRYELLELTVQLAAKGASRPMRKTVAYDLIDTGDGEWLEMLETLFQAPVSQEFRDLSILDGIASGETVFVCGLTATMKQGCSDLFMPVLARNLFEDCAEEDFKDYLEAIEAE